MLRKVLCVVSLLLVIACSRGVTLSGPSKEVTEKAVEIFNNAMCTPKWGQTGVCKDISIIRHKQLSMTDADRANGYEEKWCFNFKYIHKLGTDNVGNDMWSDGVAPIFVRKIKGVLQGEFNTDCAM